MITLPLTTATEAELWRLLQMARNQIANLKSQLRLTLCAALAAQRRIRRNAARRLSRVEKDRLQRNCSLATWRPR